MGILIIFTKNKFLIKVVDTKASVSIKIITLKIPTREILIYNHKQDESEREESTTQ